MHSPSIAFAALLSLAPVAWGQPARADAAESDAAMERAKRAAAGPLKAIQQASKITTRRRGEAEPAPGAAVVAASAALPAAAAAAPQPRAAEPAPAALVLDVDARVPAAAETPAVAPLAAGSLAPVAATALPMGTLARPLLDTLPVQPKVLEMVEPNIPPALLAQAPRGVEVEAELSLRADGTVASVTLLPPVPRAWQRYIVTALERWRYEPLAEERVHRVRLVFGNPGAS